MNIDILEEDLKRIVCSNLPWSEFRDTTVLISGANGLLPSYMVETLLYLNSLQDLNINIIGLVRNKNKALEKFARHQKRHDFQLIEQNVCAPIALSSQLDYIIHAASQASPKYYGKDPVGTLEPNVLGTYNLLKLAHNNSVKGFLFFSSSEVYGQVDDSQIPIQEDTYGYLDPTLVRSCYAESKRMGETICVSWFQQFGVPAKIVRPFHTYGPGLSLDDGRVFADFVADIVNNRNIVMKSDGSATRAFCYLSDAVSGFFTVLLKGENAQAYNIGNPECEISIIDLANKLVSLFPEKNLSVIKQSSGENSGYIQSKVSRNSPNISKANNLGWIPKISLEEGFQSTVRSFL